MRTNQYLKKKIFSFFMVFAMFTVVLGGCKGKDEAGGSVIAGEETNIENDVGKDEKSNNDESKNGGRFFESEVSLPNGAGDIRAFGKLSDGSLAAVSSNREDDSYFILVSKDFGEKWSKTKISGLKKESISQIAIAPDGGAAFISYAKEGKIQVNISDIKGKIKSFSFSFPDGGKKVSENNVWQAVYDSEKKLFVRDSEGVIYTVSSDGTPRTAFDTKGVSVNYFSIVGNTLLAVHDEGIMLFDTKSGKMLDNEVLLDDLIKNNTGLKSSDTDIGQPMIFSEGTENDGIMFVNENGIFHYTMGGNVTEQLLDGSLTELGAGGMAFLGLAVLDKENIFVATGKILRYSYDKKAVSVPDKELTVYALDESAFLRKAVILFQKENPDIHVNLEFALTGKDGVTLEDAIQTLNTNILAGKGPDVLVLDGMNVNSYIEKGILENISDVVDDVDKKDGIFKNIKEVNMRDGKIYSMPARFLISVVEGDKETVKSGGVLSSFAERAEKVKKKYPDINFTSNKGTRTLLRDLYYADSATWQKDDGTIDDNAISEYLKCAGRIYNLDSCSKSDDNLDKSWGDATFNGEKIGTNMDTGLIGNEYKTAFGSMAGFNELQEICSVRKKTKADYGILNGEKVKSYIPYLTLGVVSGGNIESAKEFVKTMLGKKMGNSENNGFSVNRSAFDMQCSEKLDSQNVKDEVSMAFSVNDSDKEYSFDYVNLTQKDVDKITKIADGVNKPSMTDRVIQEIVLEQGDKYLLGDLSLEGAVDAILKKVNLYLAE
ncbi:MAG: ABC transporter substrate-binding protein [Ruminococcus flavefaciens]|nr:ABC transporter substrate-binding protein [Ruminococcus flavefaciens]